MVVIEENVEFKTDFDKAKIAEDVVGEILKKEGCPFECEVDILITDSEEVKEYNREYRDIDKAHELMTFMVDNKENLPIPDDDAPLKILIGPENVNEALHDPSVVVASYDIGDGMRGLVGVVGPTRMDYATVAARLSYFAESLSAMFGKKNQLPPKEEEK